MIPLYFLLIPYGLFLIFYFVFFFFNTYHLVHFSIQGAGGKFLILFFVLGTAAILGTTFLLLQNTDWTLEIDPSSISNTFAPDVIIKPL